MTGGIGDALIEGVITLGWLAIGASALVATLAFGVWLVGRTPLALDEPTSVERVRQFTADRAVIRDDIDAEWAALNKGEQ